MVIKMTLKCDPPALIPSCWDYRINYHTHLKQILYSDCNICQKRILRVPGRQNYDLVIILIWTLSTT